MQLPKQRRPLSSVLLVSGSMESRSAQHIGLPHPAGAAPQSSSRYAGSGGTAHEANQTVAQTALAGRGGSARGGGCGDEPSQVPPGG